MVAYISQEDKVPASKTLWCNVHEILTTGAPKALLPRVNPMFYLRELGRERLGHECFVGTCSLP